MPGVGEAILDSGCSNSMMTHGLYKKVLADKLKRQPECNIQTRPGYHNFKIASGTVVKTLFELKN